MRYEITSTPAIYCNIRHVIISSTKTNSQSVQNNLVTVFWKFPVVLGKEHLGRQSMITEINKTYSKAQISKNFLKRSLRVQNTKLRMFILPKLLSSLTWNFNFDPPKSIDIFQFSFAIVFRRELINGGTGYFWLVVRSC